MAKRENLQHVDCINLLNLPNFLFLAPFRAVWILKDVVTKPSQGQSLWVKYGIKYKLMRVRVEGWFHSWGTMSKVC